MLGKCYNVLILGSGGREIALAWKISHSEHLSKLWIASPNTDIMQYNFAQYTTLNILDSESVIAFANKEAINLVVIGSETLLAMGMADDLRMAGIAVFGPSMAAAQLESSKKFAKKICSSCDIKTADYTFFSDKKAAQLFVQETGAPVVIKWNGLAAGKGVVVAKTQAEAMEAVNQVFALADKQGQSENGVLIEKYLPGQEVSFFACTDGTNIFPLTTARDYKRVGDGDTGRNTGGMGAISPAPNVSAQVETKIIKQIIEPCLAAMRERGTPYTGVLYAGLMIHEDEIFLIEFNARFGDPECQALMMRMDTDLLPILLSCSGVAGWSLKDCRMRWSSKSSVVLVLAAPGYPGNPHTGEEIEGLPLKAEYDADCLVFYAGILRNAQGRPVTAGGRVLNIVATGEGYKQAGGKIYTIVESKKIHFPNMLYRKDIAA